MCYSSSLLSLKRCDSSELSATDQHIYIIGPLSSVTCLHVDHVFECLVLPEHTVCALDLSCCAGHITAHTGAVGFGHSDLAHGCAALDLEFGQTSQEQDAALNICLHSD